jgi:hypothetical protein
MDRRLLGLLIIAIAGLAACGRYPSAPPAAAGYRLFLEQGYNGAGQVTVLDSGSGTVERQLPIGTPAPDWSRYYVITHVTGSERLSAIDPASGHTLGQISLAEGFQLPSLGYLGPSAGLSPNGQWLVLTRQSGSISRFLVGASSLSQPFTAVQLNGDFSFDAISNDGQSLYLIQKMGDPNHYQVRLLDVSSKALFEQPVADKREPREPMNGIRGDSVAAPNGKYVFTVYARNNGPFIHALPLGDPVAWCLDLPAKNASDVDEQFHWSLVSNQDGSLVYAVNGSSGFIAEIAPDNLPSLRRSVHVAMNASSGLLGGLVTNAEAKGARIGGSALSQDSRTLFTLGDTGIVVIDVGTLKVRSRILTGDVVESIRLSADGHWLYAAGGPSGIWQINPKTGAVAGQVKGGSATWALLWAQPK